MVEFPEPDVERLSAAGAELVALDPSQLLWRIYFRGGCFPGEWDTFRRFGPVPGGRFDHHFLPPAAQQRSVSYVAEEPGVCIAEVFQALRTVTSTSAPHLAGFRLTRPVRVLDMRGLWPTRAGGSQAIATGPTARAQRWARAVADAFPEAEGISYGSSMHGGDNAWALWNCEDAVGEKPELDISLTEPGLAAPIRRICVALGYTSRLGERSVR